MSRVPGIQQGKLPGVVCVSRQETRRPTWQVGAALETCLVSVRALSKSSHSQCFLCVRSAFSGKKKKKKQKNTPFGKFAASIQPDSSMPLAIASLQKEVLKPALHFRQGCSETEEGEADQRRFVPQSDPKTKCYR